ncbi:hypothetical protein [Wohlfahrtiimonas populi]|uniref:hypothetical protein n=1 Tax=Wohlfahrtiimonas populi TaxID=1940240 RepID=UPI00098D3741|nr:hypothetical protein [Wohlfahrtiimonas populi]
MKPKLWILPIAFLISVSYGKGFMNNNQRYTSTQKEEEKRFQENPNPQKGYRVTIKIENAPGEFEKLYTYANYQTRNCQYQLKGFAGASLQPYHRIPLEFKKISDTEYQGEFYVDGMLDEDYGYGGGICHWGFNNVSIVFSATENVDDTRFSASISDSDLNKKQLEFNHLKENYPIDEKLPRYLSQGGLKKERFKPEEYFTFYIELEEI